MKNDTAINRENGFSLIEMLVILAIVSAVSSISFSSFTGAKSRITPEFAAKEVSRMVRGARLRAISTRSTVEVIFDVSKRRIEVLGDTRVLDLPKDMKLKLETGKELVLALDRASILFFQDGASSGGRIEFALANNPTAEVSLSWINGLARTTRK